ncbi:UDP-glucose 4-epimerase family protein [Pseudomonas huanghezhanensis]|uniref:UDP-glucose 4-epimerase family protein n=1 Tax=Pseudomonas huanghezhanensis TaxID=3002903 RepID=UPI0022864364|nr:SDR family oxidoreductase [Pseudomonas sp. BSw22131]
MPTKILITGASGFLGRALVGTLSGSNDYQLTAAVRARQVDCAPSVPTFVVGNIDARTDWGNALDVDVVIHTAARVHVMHEHVDDPMALFREVNTAGTLNLATQAAKAGVRRFIFISSIKVNGESTLPGRPFLADEPCAPCDPYGLSKYEAEQGLMEMAASSQMEVVIIRPVLVYGPGVRANFQQLMRILRRGLPVPLGAVNNARSLVSLDNLVDLIRVCADHRAAANQIFLVSDDQDVSTKELARRLVLLLRSKTWLVPFPDHLIFRFAKLVGRNSSARRVLGSLQVDISKTKQLLNWLPPVSLDEGLKRTVDHFMKMEKK